MKPYIKKNIHIPLEIPEYNVDKNIAKHLPYPLDVMAYHNFTIISGRPGAGKSSLITSFLSQKKPKLFRKVYDKVYVFLPKNSMSSQKKNVFETLPPSQIFHEFDENTLDKVMKKIDENSGEHLNSLIVIDDMTASLKNSMYLQSQLKSIVYNRRHLRTTIWLSVQSYINIPKQVREVATFAFIFKPSKTQFETLFAELFELSRDEALEIMRLAYPENKPHIFMFLNIASQQIYRRFDEIIYRDDSVEGSANS